MIPLHDMTGREIANMQRNGPWRDEPIGFGPTAASSRFFDSGSPI